MVDSVKKVEQNVIKTDSGMLHIYQCKPKITNQRAVSQSISAENNLTVGDILSRRKQRTALLNMILNH